MRSLCRQAPNGQHHHPQGDLLGGLEDETVLGLDLERNTVLKKLDIDVRELLEEDIGILGIALDVRLEALVLDQGNITGQHHQGTSSLVGVLDRAVPLALVPLLLNEQTEELVAEDGRAEIPRSFETGAVGVGTAQSVSSDQSDHLAVIEAHAAEDITDVTVALGGVGKTAIGGTGGNVPVLTAGAPGDDGATELLNGGGTGQSPQVGVGDPGELGLDGLEEVTGVLQTGVGAVVRLRSETHGSTVATTSAGLLVIGTTGVPGETNEDL